MQEFSQFYFDIGWIIATILGVGVGLTCNGKTIVWWCVLMAIIGFLASYYK